MNTKIIISSTVVVVAIAGFVFFNTTTPKNPADSPSSTTPITSTPSSSSSGKTGKVAGMPAVDMTLCTKQPNDAYICPANALSDFGPATITDTNSGASCEIAYTNATGLSFKGKIKTGTITAGPLAVALYPSGNVATVARSGAQTMSFHAREDGALDHVLFVDSNYSTEQCLSVK